MTRNIKEDLFFTCSIVELIARKTKNHPTKIVNILGHKGIRYVYRNAEVLHCYPLEQTVNELISDYTISNGNYNISDLTKGRLPDEFEIGRVYGRLIYQLESSDNIQTIINVYNSFMSRYISDFNTPVYWQSPEYLLACYKSGTIL